MNYEIKEDGKYSYIEEGEGNTLVLLHGLFGALSNWTDVIDKFSKNYKVVVPLLPIYTMSLKDTGVKGLAKFAHGFIKKMGYDKVTLLGNSLGGHVALVFAKNYPELVHSMILTGSSGLYEDAMGGSYPKRGDYDYIKAKVEYTFYSPETATKELVDEVFAITNDRNKVIRILAMAKSAIRHNMREDIKDFNFPVCLIWGKQDNITPPQVGEEFHALIPDSELNWIDKCGHAPMMEVPHEFNKHAEAFLARVYNQPATAG